MKTIIKTIFILTILLGAHNLNAMNVTIETKTPRLTTQQLLAQDLKTSLQTAANNGESDVIRRIFANRDNIALLSSDFMENVLQSISIKLCALLVTHDNDLNEDVRAMMETQDAVLSGCLMILFQEKIAARIAQQQQEQKQEQKQKHQQQVTDNLNREHVVDAWLDSMLKNKKSKKKKKSKCAIQ